MKEKLTQIINKVKESVSPFLDKHIKHINPVLVAYVVFAILFVLDLFALRYFTNTGFVIACIMLVVETVLAVFLSHSNYGILGLVAIAELIVGFIAKEIPAVLLSLIVYFLALVVIHIMRAYGGKKQ